MAPDQDDIIRNIAITGKYGSGKSSVIDTYFSHYYENDYLRVSFATFKGQRQTEEENIFNFDPNEIYLNIINQVIYQVDASKIPLTGFKIKKPLTKKRKWLLIATGLLSVSWYFNLPNIAYSWFEYARNSVAIGLWLCFVWHALSSISISNLVMKVKGISTDLKLGNDDFFEKYSDEIVYLFRQSGKRILIIEDLDRFQDISVFEKLRELNTKLNANGHSNWKFLFLIKDDIFLDANDRVKFFDLIIPIVPFMTAANSYDKMREMFEDKSFDDELLFTLSLFVTDYRLLINILNEYTVFHSSTNTSERNELLTMVVYKNLYPSDFDDVQNGRGKLSEIFNEYQTFVESKKSQLVTEKQEMVKIRESTAATNEAEAFFLYVSRKSLSTRRTIASIVDAERFIAENGNIYSQNRWVNYSQFLKDDNDYKKIYMAVEKFEEQIQRLNKEIKQIEDSDIVSFVPDDLATEHDKMVWTLIRQGYIRKNYVDVVNRFYGEENSRQFLQNALVGQGELNMDLEFDSIGNWWKKLKLPVFKTPQIQNFYVLEYAKQNDRDKYEIMIRNSVNFNNEFLEKMLRHLNKPEEKNQYFEDFIEYAPTYLFNVKDLDKKIILRILNDVRYTTDPENIELLVEYLVDNLDEDLDKNLVNDTKQDIQLRLGVLTRAITQIDFEEMTDKSFWDSALSAKVVNPTITNLNQYFEENGLTYELKNFITTNSIRDDGVELDWHLFKEMLNDDISIGILNQFITKLNRKDKYNWEEFKSEVTLDKLILLIEHSMVELTADVFRTLHDGNTPLPTILISQNVVDFLTEEEIQPLTGWINQIIDMSSLNIENFLKTFIRLLDKEQYQKTTLLLSDQPEKFEKILNSSMNYTNQKITKNSNNELLLKWLVDKGYIKEFSDDGRENYTIR
ncbi:hypothetical protein FO435_06200 [Weissella cibaria]|uniref:YobI-like P-loop NTPase domain-containing protein n=2 Tax=Weissella cibaria TaxID=137591 RepID=A0A9Q8JIH4_9LACO|nr:hypothetical protein FO435_06200 [Weissella cibaria]